MEVATFGAGCYWGTDKFFRINFAKAHPGSIVSVRVGFMGGHAVNPSYEQVCSGTTGHVEVAQVVFDPKVVPYEALVRHHLTFHDPTTMNRQVNDRGDQYASVVFAHSDEQQQVASRVIDELDQIVKQGKIDAFEGKHVVTVVKKAGVFYEAKESHQGYLQKNPGGYCNHRIRFSWK